MIQDICEFANRYNLALNDPKVRELYDLDRSAKMDEASRIKHAEMNRAKISALGIRRELGINDSKQVALIVGVSEELVERWFAE